MSSQPCCVNCGLYVMHGDCLCDDCRPRVKDPKKRIAKLEVERDAAIHMATRGADSYAELEAENERLKCCGNCCWYSSSLGDCNDDVDDELDECNPSDGCHFTPPRWSFDHVDRHARAEKGDSV